MEQIEGVVKTLGPSRTTFQGTSLTVYSYIEVGDQVIKKVMVFDGMNGPLQIAVQTPASVTLYLKNGYLCGMRMPDGKAYASEMMGRFGLYAALVAAAILGLITLPLLGMGLFFFYMGWKLWKLLDAKNSAGNIPNAVFV
jgi:hypothetical protein